MAFSTGVGDLIALTEKAFAIYKFCSSAPENVRDLFEQIKHVGNQLKYITKILEVLGGRDYEHAPGLLKCLEDAEKHLRTYQTLADGSGSRASRLRSTARLGVDPKIDAIRQNLASHTKKIDDFRQDLTLAVTIRTLQLQLRRAEKSYLYKGNDSVQSLALAQDSTSSLAGQMLLQSRRDADSASIISEATEAFAMVRKLRRSAPILHLSRLDTITCESPNLEAITRTSPGQLIDASINGLIDEALSIAEKTNPNPDGQVPSPNLEDLARISSRARQLRERFGGQLYGNERPPIPVPLPTLEPSPESLCDSFFNGLPREREDRSVYHRWAAQPLEAPATPRQPLQPHQPPYSSQPIGLTPEDSIRSARQETIKNDGYSDEIFSMHSLSLSESPMDFSMSAREYIDLVGWAAILVPSRTGYIRMKCKFEIMVSQGSIWLCSIATNQRRSNSFQLSPSSPVGMTPSRLLNGQRLESAPSIPELNRTFRHCFLPESRPFPAILHPSVEGPEEKFAPYAFHFRERQFLSEEGSAEPVKQVTGLKYAFEHQNDRDKLREHIFGKTLLASAGTEKITFNSRILCHQQEAALWLNTSDSGSEGQIVTVTFSRTTSQGQIIDVEHQVLGSHLESAGRGTLSLMVKSKSIASPLAQTSESPLSPVSRRSSWLTHRTSRSHSSTSSGRVSSPEARCVLEFSEISDRKVFWNLLQQYVMA